MKTLSGTDLSSRYRLWEVMHAGTAASTYLAYDRLLERKVVIKLLNPKASENPDVVERFGYEARLVARLKHENIVAVIDSDEYEGVPYIVFEYVEGEPLEKFVRRHGPCAIDDAVAFTIEAARGLCVAHSRGIVHGGISSEIILVDYEGQTKIADFGVYPDLSTRYQPRNASSPEQAIGKPATAQTDIYGLGIVLFELLAGLPPFVGTDLEELVTKHIREQLPDIQVYRPEVSASLAAVIEHMTEKDPAHRYSSAAIVISELQDALNLETARAGKTGRAIISPVQLMPRLKQEHIPNTNRQVDSPKSDRRHLMKVGALGSIGAFTLALILALLNTNEPHKKIATTNHVRETQASNANGNVKLISARDYDPLGDGHEHPHQVKFALDPSPSTRWTTDRYFSGKLSKKGVGIYFQAAESVAAKTLIIQTPEIGWKAQIYSTNTPSSEFPDPSWQLVGETTIVRSQQRIRLNTHGKRTKFYLVWITQLPPRAMRVAITKVQLLAPVAAK